MQPRDANAATGNSECPFCSVVLDGAGKHPNGWCDVAHELGELRYPRVVVRREIGHWGQGDPSMWGSAKELAWHITHKQPVLLGIIVFCLTTAVLSAR